jgi:hypothetical protein
LAGGSARWSEKGRSYRVLEAEERSRGFPFLRWESHARVFVVVFGGFLVEVGFELRVSHLQIRCFVA